MKLTLPDHPSADMGDRLAPPTQARALYRHWGDPDMCWYPSYHVGYLWSDKAWSFVDDMLESRGFTG